MPYFMVNINYESCYFVGLFQAFVVADAYHVTVDWSESLFLHVLLLGNNHYLEEFQRHIKLSSTLIKSTLLK